MPFTTSAMVFRRDAMRCAGEFEGGVLTDLDMLARMAEQGRVSTVMEPLGTYRLHGASMTASRQREYRVRAEFIAARLEARKHGATLSWTEFESHYRPNARQRRADRAALWLRTAGLHAVDRQLWLALAYLALATCAGPLYTVRRLARQLRFRGSHRRES